MGDKVIVNLATGLEDAERFATAGGRLQVCPICFNARRLDDTALVAHAETAGTVPLFDWIGGQAATVFSY